MSARGIRPEDIGPLGNIAKPAPSAEPERLAALLRPLLPWFSYGHIQEVAHSLSRAGLAIVPAADVPSAEERKALEAVEEAKSRLLVMIESLEADEDGTTDNDLLLVDLDGIRNVLARRVAKDPK